jgi:hypothetical protein
MGKRELVIILAFVVAGVLAYQLSVPASEEGTPRFSLSSMMARFRREIRGNRASASVTTRRALELSRGLTEARISGIAHVTVTGEARQDIEYALSVESNGPDDASAREFAARTRLIEDRVGSVVILRAEYPREMRQVASISLAVPARMGIRVDGYQGGATIEVSNTGSLQLDGVVGDVRVSRMAGAVTGTHRNGDLVVADAGDVSLTLVSSNTTLERLRGRILLVARNGRSQITDAAGPIEVEATNEDISIARPADAVRIRGSGGAVRVDDPGGEVNIDVRRSAVDVMLARARPLTILTTDAPLRLHLVGPPSVSLDALAAEGTIDAVDFSLTPEAVDQDARLRHTFGTAAAAVALRNRRAPIVIDRAK